ncbi:hypothetical protein ACWDSJ_36985 [Nocardia sp. NPDC003482]
MTMNDPRVMIQDIVTDDADRCAGLRVLQYAIEWSAATVAAALADAEADSAAVEVVIALDDALGGVDQLVGNVTALADTALIGEPVRVYLEEKVTALTVLSEQLTLARLELQSAEEAADELAASSVEYERLSSRLGELSRLRELSEALPEVREQYDRLIQHHDAMIDETAEAEQALRDTAEQLVTLSTQRRATLDERTRAALEQIQRGESDRIAAAQRCADAATELAQLRDLHASRIAALQAYASANNEVLQRLIRIDDDADGNESIGQRDGSVLETARRILGQVQSSLERVDGELGRALKDYDEATQAHRKVIPWRDDM